MSVLYFGFLLKHYYNHKHICMLFHVAHRIGWMITKTYRWSALQWIILILDWSQKAAGLWQLILGRCASILILVISKWSSSRHLVFYLQCVIVFCRIRLTPCNHLTEGTELELLTVQKLQTACKTLKTGFIRIINLTTSGSSASA